MEDKAGEAFGLETLLTKRMQRLAARLAMVGRQDILRGTGIQTMEWDTICLLVEHGPLRLSEIARTLSLDPGHVSRILRRAETRDLVSRHDDPYDARVSIVKLTPLGRHLFDEIWPGEVALNKAFRDLFSPSERAAFVKLLDRATQQADTMLSVSEGDTAETPPPIARQK